MLAEVTPLNLVRRTRLQSGTMLGMIAGLVFIVFVIGAFVFFGARLFGGNAQLNNATDEGILSAAKNALVRPAVALNDPVLTSAKSLPYSDFNQLCDQQVAGIPAVDLNIYNRLVGQAMIVCQNALAIGTPEAYADARLEVQAVQGVGNLLRKKLVNGGVDAYFDQQTSLEDLNLLGLNRVIQRKSTLDTSWVGNTGAPLSSNLYIDPSALPGYDPAQPGYSVIPSLPMTQKPNNQVLDLSQDTNFGNGSQITPYYVDGYNGISLLAAVGPPLTLYTVPLEPRRVTHLIDNNNRFEPQMFFGDPDVPPNSFRAATSATTTFTGAKETSKSTHFNVNAISCAIAAGATSYVAAMPGAFIRVQNLASAQAFGAPATSNDLIDGSKDLFNGDCATAIGTKIAWVSPNDPTLITHNAIALDEWLRFAASAGARGNVEKIAGVAYNRNLDPLVPYGDAADKHRLSDVPSPGIRVLAQPTKHGQLIVPTKLMELPPATLSDLLAMRVLGPNPALNTFDLNTLGELSKGKNDRFIKEEILDFLGDPTGGRLLGGEYKKLVDGTSNILTTSIFPLADAAFVNEPAWADDKANQYMQIFNKITGVLQGESLPNTTGVRLIKEIIRKFRAENPNNYKLVVSTVLANANQIRSGIRYYERTGKNPFPNPKYLVNAYIPHYAQYAHLVERVVGGKGVWQQVGSPTPDYEKDGTAAKLLEVINKTRNGPLPVVGSNNQVVYSNGSNNAAGDHTFNSDDLAGLLGPLTERCREIDPAYTQADVMTALGFTNTGANPAPTDNFNATTLGVTATGSTLYLHKDQKTGKLVCDANVPYDDLHFAPDSQVAGSSPALHYSTGPYIISGDKELNSLINTAADGSSTAMHGDCGYHNAPYLISGDIGSNNNVIDYQYSTTTDSVDLYLSSGYKNLLGAMTFGSVTTTKTFVGKN